QSWNFGGADAIEQERQDIEAFDRAVDALVAVSRPIARFGDGNCGQILLTVKKSLEAAGLYREPERGSCAPKKQVISNQVRTEVFERDAYRCLRCGTHKNLRADHVLPESKGGVASLENLQTLCQPCNSWKGTKTIDFRRAE